MYHHQWDWGGGGDAILPSRPDALLANGGGGGGGSPLPPSSYSYMDPSPPLLLVPPPHDSRQLQSEEEQSCRAAPPPVRYSAEERRERIDKYRSKRNQRNFQKKITYACRKTLADSRPRVKGRFARNAAGDYTDADAAAAADHVAAAQVQAAAESPHALVDLPTPALPEWWTPSVQELPSSINLADLCAADDDDDILAAYLGVSSISIADHHYSCQP
ncbi:hypothetical protein BS78_05G001000 [Paspalum vaginatum]|nr:hypothetical protein BS78_05G001000 [Paspalum vaginatum]